MSFLGLHQGIPPLKPGSGGTPSLTTQALDILTSYGASMWLPGDTSFEENKTLSDGSGALAINGDPVGWAKNITGVGSAVQATTANKPILTLDSGVYHWNFDGINDGLALPAALLDSALTMFCVYMIDLPAVAPASTQIIAGYYGGGSERAMVCFLSTGILRPYCLNRDTAGNALNTGSTFSARTGGETVVIAARKTGTSQRVSLRGSVNASEVATDTNGSISTYTANTGNIGQANSGSNFSGDIRGAIIGNGNISDAELNTLGSFLAERNNITLIA